jgi:Uma2 family endonuclease
MGIHTSGEALALRWAEVCNDPLLRDLPYKIELNAFGNIEMSPASNRHGRLQFKVGQQLAHQLPDGDVVTECSIATEIGVRVPDVVWASSEFLLKYGDATPYPQAPEICVEVRSPSNAPEEMELKTRAYLAAGAVEVWVVSEDGELSVFDANGRQARTRYPVTLTLPPRAPHNDED